MDPSKVSEMYKGDINQMDAVRRYATILDWDNETFENFNRTIQKSFERDLYHVGNRKK